MAIIDTHCHLYLEQFDEDREATLARATEHRVERFYLPNIDASTTGAMNKMVQRWPGQCFAMMGLHPCSVKAGFEAELEAVEQELRSGNYVAVGEIGIDMHWDKSTLPIQAKAFEQQVEWAKELSLPIVIHARESFNEIFEVLDRVNDDRLFGIFHCFTGGIAELEKIRSYGGFKLGIGGVVTFKNGGLDKTLENVDLEELVLETDSPYIAPAPFRGKRNEPAYLTNVVEKLAEIYACSTDRIEEITTKNALDIFER